MGQMPHGSDEYRRVLSEWAAGVLPSHLGSTGIIDVRLKFHEDYIWSEWTADDARLSVEIDYLDLAGGTLTWQGGDKVALSITSLLRKLFRLADLISSPPTLSATDPEPGERAIVQDRRGHYWRHTDAGWFDEQQPQPWTLEPWTKVVRDYGPVTLLRSGHASTEHRARDL